MSERIHWAWIILIASFVTVFTAYSIRLSYGILLPEMIVSLKITKAQAGVIASSFYLAYTIFSPLLGFLVDRFDARKLLVLFCFIMGVGTFIWPFFLAAATGVLGVIFFSRVKKPDQTYPGQGNQKKVVVKNKSML